MICSSSQNVWCPLCTEKNVNLNGLFGQIVEGHFIVCAHCWFGPSNAASLCCPFKQTETSSKRIMQKKMTIRYNIFFSYHLCRTVKKRTTKAKENKPILMGLLWYSLINNSSWRFWRNTCHSHNTQRKDGEAYRCSWGWLANENWDHERKTNIDCQDRTSHYLKSDNWFLTKRTIPGWTIPR